MCQSVVAILEAAPEDLVPVLQPISEFMLHASQDANPEVRPPRTPTPELEVASSLAPPFPPLSPMFALSAAAAAAATSQR